MTLRYDDLTVRNAEDRDVLTLVMWWNDGKVMAHAGFPRGLGTTPHKVSEQLAEDDENKAQHLIIEIGEIPVGEMSYKILHSNTAEIGIKICEKDYQDKGYGKKFLSMLISELFGRGYEKIVLGTNYRNKRARHVYQQLGFEEVEIAHDNWIDQLGEPQSTVYCRLLPEKFVSYIK